MKFIAGFILCSNLFVCEAYVDPKPYASFEECKEGGTELYKTLEGLAKEDDKIVGDCFYVLDSTIEEKDVKAIVKESLMKYLGIDGKGT